MDETRPVKYLPARRVAGGWRLDRVVVKRLKDGSVVLVTDDGTVIEEGDGLRPVPKPTSN